MNDLRSRNRTLAPVPSIGPKTGEIVSSRPSRRPRGNPLFQSSRLGVDDAEDHHGGSEHGEDAGPSTAAEPEVDGQLTFKVSRELRTMPVTALIESERSEGENSESENSDNGPSEGETAELTERGAELHPEVAEDEAGYTSAAERRRRKGLVSRPTKRREVHDAEEGEDDKFPWHYQFDEDEPEELQAKSPLLSRAFRSSVG